MEQSMLQLRSLFQGLTYQDRRKVSQPTRKLAIEHLERRALLSINWLNDGSVNNSNADLFNTYYAGNADQARAIVRRAIADWESVISNFNYAEDGNDGNPNNNLNNTFSLTVVAESLAGDTRGVVRFADTLFSATGSPRAATVRLDDNGAGAGWFFDATPLDDAEFTGLADMFSSSFVDINGQSARDDFYRTTVHEIGHALGITSDPTSSIMGMFKSLVHQNGTQVRDLGTGPQLVRFKSTRPAPMYGVTATFVGGHIYEGDIYDGTNNDPVTVYEQGNLSTPIAFQTHPNELLNPGRAVPAGNPNPPPPNETARQWISDLDAKILADAYGYTVVLPSTFNTAHATLDSQTGTLLVQGRVWAQFDTIDIDTQGTNIRVRVNGTTELFPTASVSHIVIAQNGGVDAVNVSGIAVPVNQVQYVVSSNQDSAAAETPATTSST
jgi:hypothetical protein